MSSGKKLTREWVRDHFPEACKIAAEFEAICPGIQLLSATENGNQIGRVVDESKFKALSVSQFLEMGERSRQNAASVELQERRGGKK